MMERFKGQKGYISLLKKYDLAFIAASALTCFLVYYAGLRIWHSKANIGTVVAICSLLPACKRLTNLIMIFMFKGIDDSDYTKIEPNLKEGWFILCDMLFSTEKCMLEFDHVVMTNSKMIILSKMSKEKNTYALDYFRTAFKKRALSMKVSLSTDADEYAAVLSKTDAESFTNEKASEYVTSLMV